MSKLACLVMVVLLSSSALVLTITYENDVCNVIFMVDGKEYYSTAIIKGETIDEMPVPPEKIGYDVVWDYTGKTINNNTVINAVYTKNAFRVYFDNPYTELVNIYVYETQDYVNKNAATLDISRDPSSGGPVLDGSGQINFQVDLAEGFYIDSIEIFGKYKNIKNHETDTNIPENCYRITKISSDLIVKISPNVELTFDKQSGFYDGEIEFNMYSAGEIHYTLDGSTPTSTSPLYTSPLKIIDASYNQNIYSSRTDLSTGFYNGEYVAPTVLVDKCTIVRAVAFYKELSNEKHASFFVGFNEKTGYDGVRIISMITDPANLFSYENGIYVTGKLYDDYLLTVESPESWERCPANYTQKGKDWERPAIIQIFDTSGEVLIDQNAGIRIHGGISRAFVPRSINLYARSEYGNDCFDADLFGTGFNPQRVTLFQGGNDYVTMSLDKIITEQTQELNLAMYHYVPYILFLDGEYWGIYWMTEQFDKEYFEYYVGIEDVSVIKNGEIEEGHTPGYSVTTVLESLSHLDYSDDNNYNLFKSIIDINDYTNYNALQMYISNYDWNYGFNCAFWKNESPILGTDPRWKMAVFDLNASCFNDLDKEIGPIEYHRQSDMLFDALMENLEFREQLYDAFDNVSEMLNPIAMKEKLEEYKTMMSPRLSKEYERFYSQYPNTMYDFESYIDTLKDYFEYRYSVIHDYLI